MRRVLVLAINIFFISHAIAAGFIQKNESEYLIACSNAKTYLSLSKQHYSIEGFESFVGHKLNNIEKKVYKQLRKSSVELEDKDSLKKNRRLGMISLGLFLLTIGLLIISPTFVVGMIAIGTFLASFILGVITIKKANKQNLGKGSGKSFAIPHVIVALLVLLLAIISIPFIIAN